MSILSIKDLHVNYGAIRALKGINIEVEPGEIVTLIGANGAGKSSTMNAVMHMIPKASGTITFNGEDITKMDTALIVKKGLILAPEGRQIFPDLSVKDNLMLGGYNNPVEENEKIIETVFEIFPVLKERINQMGGTLSGGEQQMLAIGRAYMAKPKVLMLDEPSLGLAPLLIQEVFNMIKMIRDKGVAILLVEQNARMALKISDRGYVIETGNIVHEDKAVNLLASEAVAKAYLS